MSTKQLPTTLIGKTMGEAMDAIVSCETEEEAGHVTELLVAACLYHDPELTEEKAREIALENVGYCTGYYDSETAERVFKLFKTKHPIFGTTRPSAEEAFKAGQDLAAKQ